MTPLFELAFKSDTLDCTSTTEDVAGSLTLAEAVGATVSPSAPRCMSGSSTVATSPTLYGRFMTNPSAKASTSKLAFSDSTTATKSPLATLSPTLTCNSTTVASVKSCPTWGTKIASAISKFLKPRATTSLREHSQQNLQFFWLQPRTQSQ